MKTREDKHFKKDFSRESEQFISDVPIFSLPPKKGNRTFAEKEKSNYTKSENKNERNVDNDGTRLHTSRRRASPQSDTSKAEEFDFREICVDEEEFPQGELQNSIYQSADELRTRRTSLGNRTESERDGRTVDVENGSTRGTDRGTQGERPNGLGTGNEQPETKSTGNRFKRNNLHALNPICHRYSARSSYQFC